MFGHHLPPPDGRDARRGGTHRPLRITTNAPPTLAPPPNFSGLIPSEAPAEPSCARTSKIHPARRAWSNGRAQRVARTPSSQVSRLAAPCLPPNPRRIKLKACARALPVTRSAARAPLVQRRAEPRYAEHGRRRAPPSPPRPSLPAPKKSPSPRRLSRRPHSDRATVTVRACSSYPSPSRPLDTSAPPRTGVLTPYPPLTSAQKRYQNKPNRSSEHVAEFDRFSAGQRGVTGE